MPSRVVGRHRVRDEGGREDAVEVGRVNGVPDGPLAGAEVGPPGPSAASQRGLSRSKAAGDVSVPAGKVRATPRATIRPERRSASTSQMR